MIDSLRDFFRCIFGRDGERTLGEEEHELIKRRQEERQHAKIASRNAELAIDQLLHNLKSKNVVPYEKPKDGTNDE